MKKLINFLTITLIAFIIVSCCSQKKATNTVGIYGLSLKYNLVIDNAKQYQVDSLITADNLPNINKWIGGSFIDYETGNKITKRMYIKKGGEESFVYVIMGNNEPFKITKRVEE
jgi:hypothetical protein